MATELDFLQRLQRHIDDGNVAELRACGFIEEVQKRIATLRDASELTGLTASQLRACSSEELDELVIDAKIDEAIAINDDGRPAQYVYLLGLGPQGKYRAQLRDAWAHLTLLATGETPSTSNAEAAQFIANAFGAIFGKEVDSELAPVAVGETVAAVVVPVVTADIYSDDRVFDLRDVDVTAFFAQASDRQIFSLAQCGWGGDYPADAVAHYISNCNDTVADMFGYLERVGGRKNAPGFEVQVNREQALAYLRACDRTIPAEPE